MDIQTIRELAEKYSHAELEACIDEHISEGKNACWCCDSAEETVNILSKASYNMCLWVHRQSGMWYYFIV